MSDKTYKVYMTPLIREQVYGTEVEISDYVINNSLGNIRKNTDADDGSIGEYTLGSCDLTCANYCGEFNEADPRSFFPYKRDGSKIRVTYFDDLTDSTLSFKGLVNDEGTTQDNNDNIRIKVIELANILRKEQVAAGTVNTGDTFSGAIKALLDQTAIKAVLNYSSGEIAVGLDLAIDTAGSFANVSTWDSIKNLLIASNSVIYIDNETVKVKARSFDTGLISYFYGPGDQLDRENVVKITRKNNGAHRIFNSITVNETTYNDDPSIEWFGLKEKTFTLDFITSETKEQQIAEELVNQFRYPRQEFEMTVPTSLANGVDFFDTIGVSHPVRSRPLETTHDAIEFNKILDTDGNIVLDSDGNIVLSITEYPANAVLWDAAKYDSNLDVWNIDFGGTAVDGRLAFKIISRSENPGEFLTTLKMRGRGKTFDDGVLIYWAAIWDQSLYNISTW